MSLLTKTEASLPGAWYHDPEHYTRELAAIWYRDWVCVGRESEIARPGDFVLAQIGDESLIVMRDRGGRPRVFGNSCRHRGSRLCTEQRGRWPNGRIVCPYHGWTYALDGALVATPKRLPSADFRMEDYPLHATHVECWGGFVFVNLDESPSQTLREFLGEEALALEHWPLAELRVVHQERKQLACNWKVYWENYSECYHCPGLHPELCRLVPVYGQGVLRPSDLPGWQPSVADDTGRPRVAPGVETWTTDGRTVLPDIPGVDSTLRAHGMVFASFTASMFIVGHSDYVRSVRIVPCGPERIELVIDWMVSADAPSLGEGQLAHLLDLGRLVIEQDGRACELNQMGLRSRRHREGVLVPQEHGVWEFHEWLRGRLGVASARTT